MKMIITGTSGFIGSRLLQAARAFYGNDVTSFSSLPAEGSQIVYRDIEDFGLNPDELALVHETEVLIHAGAFTPKKGIDANQLAGCNRNIAFTEKLLALPFSRLKKIIFLSTIDVYANVEGNVSEDSPTLPATLYGLSKLYCERMVTSYAATHGFDSQVLRIGHVYGPGEEKYSKVLPKAIKSIVSGEDVELWGEGTELRSFIYIDDVVTSILKAVQLQEQVGVINVVSGNAISIRDLLKKLIIIGGRHTGIVQREFSGVTRDLVFDNTKLRHFLLPEESDFTTGLQTEFSHIEKLNVLN
jgi:UDP-glucose 4-epimerase